MKTAIALILSFALSTFAQTGGTYAIEQNSVAGGGAASSGGNFTLDDTSGQPAAGRYQQGGAFVISSGFWSSDLIPTAASVSVSGRVLTTSGSGLENAIVLMTDINGQTRTVRTSAFGYFVFDSVETGQTYIVSVQSKRFQFTPQIVSLLDEITELNFTAL